MVDKDLSAAPPPWTYISQREREAEATKQAKKQEARLKTAIDKAPKCSECGKAMTLRQIGRDGELPPGSGTWWCEHCFSKSASLYIPETDVRSKEGKEVSPLDD